MKIPISWLREFVPFRVGVEELARRLTLGGFEVEAVLNLEGEKVLEVNVSPNRGDCLSILGIAREVAALLNLPLHYPRRGKKTLSPQRKRAPLSVSVKAPRACPQYSMAVFSGVKVAPSPDWLVRRLATVGIRSINNVVDMTNYVMVERGQPLHAFDLQKISGRRILVRLAQNGERLLTLDGEENELTQDDLVITDQEKPLALAGIMGGKDSEIDENSTEIGIESAFFDPVTVRRSAKRLGIQTESSCRFERRVDFKGILPALDCAGELIQKLGRGEFQGSVTYPSSHKLEKRKIPFLPEFLESRLGGRWNSREIRKAFQRLSFPVAVKGGRDRAAWEISVPSYRSDIVRREDLIEEVCRLLGLDRIPLSFPPLLEAPPAGPEPLSLMERRARRLMADLGLNEVIHLSFLSPADLSAFDPALRNQAVTLANPLGVEYSVMRPTLLPSLLKTAAFHHRHKIFNVRLFELRKRFVKEGKGIKEGKSLAVLLTGQSLYSHWSGKKEEKETDFPDLKGILKRLVGELGYPDFSFESGGASFLHPGRQAVLCREGTSLGLLGEIHPEIQERFELKKNTFVFELDWDLFVSSPTRERHFAEYSRTPIVERDLALVVDEQLSAGSLVDFIKRQDPAIQEVTLFDLYRGAPIVPGKKSLAFSILLGLKDRTLTDEEIQAVFSRVMEGVKKTFGAEVR